MHRITLILPVLLLMAVPSSGQALPDLAPREVEIRGELSIAFPSLRRQPLIGFNPPPRVPEIDVRRMPFLEPYKQESADLPQNPLENPSTPRALASTTGPGFTGTFETGFGRYATRYALLEATLFASRTSRWTVDADYDGRTSYAPFGHDAQADGFGGGTTYASSGQNFSYGIEGSGRNDFYVLYGADTAGPAGDPAPSRTRSDIEGKFWLGSGSSSRVGYRASVAGFSGRSKTDYLESVEDPRAERTDTGVTGHLRITTGAFQLDGSAGSITLDGSSNANRAVGHFDAGAALRLRLGGATTLQAGGRVLGFEANPVATGGIRRALSYASPSLELESAVAPNIRLEVSQRPELGSARAADLFAESPFLADEVYVEPVVYPLNVTARVRGFWDQLQVCGLVTYRQSPNWRVFQHAANHFAGYPLGITSIRHTEGRFMSVGAEARLSPAAGVEARLGARVQEARLTDLDSDIPYVAPWAVDGLVSTTFAGGKGLLQATTEVLGPRNADVAGTLEVEMHADLDFRLSYEFAGSAIASFELRNLLGETPYWLNYPEPPATLVLGLGWRW